jgi:tRNA nucleotidyltransferase (CCA-adding enzyme)
VSRVLRSRPPLSIGDLALDGGKVMTTLGVSPGRVVGDALKHLLDRVIEDPSMNTSAALESELRAWWGARSASAGGAG